MQKTALFIFFLFINLLSADETRLNNLSNRMDLLYQANSDSAIWCGETALHIADSLGLDSMQISLHSRLGYIRKTKGDMFTAKEHYEKAVELESDTNAERNANRRLNLGDIYSRTGEHEKAVEVYQEALQYYETQQDIDGIVGALLGIGYTYQMMKTFDLMLKYYHQALSFEKQLDDLRVRAGVFNNLANGLKLTGDYGLALFYYDKALSLSQTIKNVRGESSTLNNIAGCYKKQGDLQTSLKYYEKALTIKRRISDSWGIANTLNNMAIVLAKTGKVDSAIALVKESRILAENADSDILLKNNYLISSNIYAKQEQFDSAYVHLKISATFKDSILNETVTKQVTEMEAKYQSEKKERENAELRLDILEKQERLNRHRRATFYLVVAVFILVGFVWFYIYRYKMSQKVLAQENEIHTQKETLHQKEEEILKQKIEHRDRELITRAMAMVQKNELLLKLVEDIEEFSTLDDQKQSRLISKIISRIRREVEGTDEWEEFRSWYEETSGEFLASLHKHYPNLSPMEVKLSALIRLGLTTKDIAGLLSREIATIEKGRYRLRKKLNLQPNENLTKFLLSL